MSRNRPPKNVRQSGPPRANDAVVRAIVRELFPTQTKDVDDDGHKAGTKPR